MQIANFEEILFVSILYRVQNKTVKNKGIMAVSK